MEKSGSTKRNSSAEMLRILAMALIVISHYSLHGAIAPELMPMCANKIFLQSTVLGNIGVDIFMLIAGYYGVNGTFKPKKLILLMAQVWFYSVVLYGIAAGTGVVEFSTMSLVKALFPTTFMQYWFVTVYVVIYFFSPYLNKMLKALSAHEMKTFLTGMLVIWSIVPILLSDFMYVDEFIQLTLIYCIGAGLSRFPNSKWHKKKFGVWLTVVCAVLLPLSVYIINVLIPIYPELQNDVRIMYSKNSVLTIGLAVGLLLCFVNKPKTSNKTVDVIASCTFGVYIIHDSPSVRHWLWNSVFNNGKYAFSPLLVVHMIICAAIVFAVCVIIELVRKNTVEKLLIKALDKCKKLN